MGNVSKQKPDIRSTVQRFAKKVNAFHRYASWEYCHAHFLKCHEKQASIDCDLAALNLGFYLASWGMMRGSTALLQRSYKVHVDIVPVLFDAKYDELWRLNPIKLNGDGLDNAWTQIWELRVVLADRYGKYDVSMSDVLFTKILLGTMACIPAYDEQFRKGLKATLAPVESRGMIKKFGKNSFKEIVLFYAHHQEDFESLTSTIKFNDKKRTYPPMKILDMYFWQMGTELPSASVATRSQI